MSEDQIQAKCYQWFHNTFPERRGLLFSVPNGGYRNKIEATKLKATGCVSGICDILYLYKPGVCSVIPIGIEMKTETGVVSPEQKKIHAIWEANGIKVYICRSFEQFQEIINEIHSGFDIGK